MAKDERIIRDGVMNDLPDLVAIDSGEEHFEVHIHKDMGRSRLLVAENAGKLVGFLMFATDFPWVGRGVFIRSIGVAEDARQQGIATELIQAVEERALYLEYIQLYSSHAADNVASRALHDACGFEVVAANFKLVDQEEPEVFRGKILL